MEQALEELKGYARDVLTAMFPDAVEVEEATMGITDPTPATFAKGDIVDGVLIV